MPYNQDYISKLYQGLKETGGIVSMPETEFTNKINSDPDYAKRIYQGLIETGGIVNLSDTDFYDRVLKKKDDTSYNPPLSFAAPSKEPEQSFGYGKSDVIQQAINKSVGNDLQVPEQIPAPQEKPLKKYDVGVIDFDTQKPITFDESLQLSKQELAKGNYDNVDYLTNKALEKPSDNDSKNDWMFSYRALALANSDNPDKLKEAAALYDYLLQKYQGTDYANKLLPNGIYTAWKVGDDKSAVNRATMYINNPVNYESEVQDWDNWQVKMPDMIHNFNNISFCHTVLAKVLKDNGQDPNPELKKADYYQKYANGLKDDYDKRGEVDALGGFPDWMLENAPILNMVIGAEKGLDKSFDVIKQGKDAFINGDRWRGTALMALGMGQAVWSIGGIIPEGEGIMGALNGLKWGRDVENIINGAKEIKGSKDWLKTPVGFLFPEYAKFNLALTSLNTVGADKYVSYVTQPVSKVLNYLGIEPKGELGKAGVGYADMIGMMVLLHAGKVMGGKIGAELTPQEQEYTKLYNKVRNKEPLTSSEDKTLKSIISQSSPQDIISSMALTDKNYTIANKQKSVNDYLQVLKVQHPEIEPLLTSDPTGTMKELYRQTLKSYNDETDPDKKSALKEKVTSLQNALSNVKQIDDFHADLKYETGQLEKYLKDNVDFKLDDRSANVLDKLDKNEPIISSELYYLSDQLYGEYKRLNGLKEMHPELNPEVIDAKIATLEDVLDKVEGFAQQQEIIEYDNENKTLLGGQKDAIKTGKEESESEHQRDGGLVEGDGKDRNVTSEVKEEGNITGDSSELQQAEKEKEVIPESDKEQTNEKDNREIHNTAGAGDSGQTNALEQKSPPTQKIKRKGIPKRNLAIKDPNRIKAGKLEVFNPYDYILQEISGRNDITVSRKLLKQLFGSHKKNAEGELRKRIGLIGGDKEKTFDGLVHDLWNNAPEWMQEKFTTMDFKDELEKVLSDFNSREAMAKDLVDRYEQGLTPEDKKYNDFILNNYDNYPGREDEFSEFINEDDNMTDDEANKILNDEVDIGENGYPASWDAKPPEAVKVAEKTIEQQNNELALNSLRNKLAKLKKGSPQALEVQKQINALDPNAPKQTKLTETRAGEKGFAIKEYEKEKNVLEAKLKDAKDELQKKKTEFNNRWTKQIEKGVPENEIKLDREKVDKLLKPYKDLVSKYSNDLIELNKKQEVYKAAPEQKGGLFEPETQIENKPAEPEITPENKPKEPEPIKQPDKVEKPLTPLKEFKQGKEQDKKTKESLIKPKEPKTSEVKEPAIKPEYLKDVTMTWPEFKHNHPEATKGDYDAARESEFNNPISDDDKIKESISERLRRLSGAKEIVNTNPLRDPTKFEDVVGLVQDLIKLGTIRLSDGIDKIVDYLKTQITGIKDKYWEDIKDDLVKRLPSPESVLTKKLNELPNKSLSISDRFKNISEIFNKEGLTIFKDNTERILSNLKENLKTVWDAYAHEPSITDFDRALGRWGEAQQLNDKTLIDFIKTIEKKVPDKSRRIAIINYIEAAGNIENLKEKEQNSKPKFQKGYNDAQSLTPDELQIAKNIRDYFDAMLKIGYDAGILKSMIENYVTHFNVSPDEPKVSKVIGGFDNGKLHTNFNYAKKRVFETFFDLEQAGFISDKDLRNIIPGYSQAFNRTIYSRAFIKNLTVGKAKDGRPIVGQAGIGSITDEVDIPNAAMVNPYAKPEELADYKIVNHPAFRGWYWAAKTPEGTNVFAKGDLVVHPDHYNHLSSILGRSDLLKSPTFRKIMTGVNVSKQTVFMLSPFFHYVQEGLHAVGHTVNPLWGLTEFDPKNIKHLELLRGGLQLYDFNGKNKFAEGLAASTILRNLPVFKSIILPLVDHLFDTFIPKLKLTTALHMVDRNMKRYGAKLTREQIVSKSADQANAAYGKLNMDKIGRNPTLQNLFKLVSLAPDFFEARIRFVGQALKPGGAEQRRALVILAGSMYITARILNKTFDDDYHWDKPFSFIYNKKQYTLRSVPEDIYELISDPRRFTYNRMSPFFRSVVIEGLTRRDYRGVPETTSDWLKSIVTSPMPTQVTKMLPESWGKNDGDNKLWDNFINTIGIRERGYLSPTETNIRNLYYERNPAGRKSENQENKIKIRKQIAKLVEENKAEYPIDKITDLINSNVEKKKITVTQGLDLLDNTGGNTKNMSVQMFKELPIDDKMDIKSKMTLDEKKLYDPENKIDEGKVYDINELKNEELNKKLKILEKQKIEGKEGLDKEINELTTKITQTATEESIKAQTEESKKRK